MQRSSGFVILSIIVHLLCITALALTPTRTVSPDKVGETLEVKIGESADKPGIAEAPPSQEPSKPQAITEAPPETKAPEVKAEPKPIVAKPAPVAKKATSHPKKTVAKAEPAPEAPIETTASVEPKAEPTPAPEKEVLTPVQDTVPAGIEAATSDEKESDSKAETTAAAAQTGEAAPIAVSAIPQPTGELSQGGTSKDGAVSYLDLRQAPGNKPPLYPQQARLEKRQGGMELVYRVTKEGRVTDIQVAKSSGFKDLDNEAVKAIALYRFVPGQEGWARHPVNFTLKGAVVSLPSRLRGKDAQAD